MKQTILPKIVGILTALMFVTGSIMLLFGIAEKAHANQSAFARVQSSVATTTYSAIAAGVGTTTISYTSSNGNLASDSAVLDLQLNASTTAPVIAYRIEHSYDGIDWYAETATSSSALTYNVTNVTFATSTDAQFGSAGSGSTNRVHREVTITTPTRFTRAVLYGISGSGSLYGEIVAKQQVNN